METEIKQAIPNPEKRFGHTLTMINKERAIMFGGAVGDGIYRITNDTFSYDCRTNIWTALKPKNNEECPSPRAAHASTAVEANQLVIFGGAHSHGNLVDNELYLLKLSSNETNGKWVKVPVKGERPSSRYGHSMVFFKPFILVTGGNMGNEPSNEVWSLSIDKSPFYWEKIKFEDQMPIPRVYHSTTIWKSPERGNMVLLFGGRNSTGNALNDLWGLRRHKSGVWDWIIAPKKQGQTPTARYQHTMLCSKNLAIMIGGRNNSSTTKDVPIDVYNLSNSEWLSFKGINRFRHVSWLSYNKVFTHGGFESKQPNVPINLLTSMDLNELFQDYEILLSNIETPYSNNKDNNGDLYKLKESVLVAQYNDNKGMKHFIKLNDLTQEPMKIIDQSPIVNQEQDNLHIKSLHSTVLRYFLKPKEWVYVENQLFPMKSEIIIALCNAVIKVLKQEPMLVHLRAGVKIIGSIHGQFGDLMRFFNAYGVPDNDPNFDKSDIECLDYLFLGNYIDRGKNSLEVICTLLALKLKFPRQIHLLRGSHEDRKVSKNEGLGFECETRLKEDISQPNSVFNKLNEVFEYFTLAAVIDKKILCLHSGIGNNFKNLKDLEKIRKPFRINHKDLGSLAQKIVYDILWSDPVQDINNAENIKNENRNYLANGTIIRFGTDRISQFLEENKLEIIIRSHECVMDGAEAFGDTNLYTIFSCTDYGGKFGNNAAIFHFHNRTKQLKTLSMPVLKGSTFWYSMKEIGKKKKGLDVLIEKQNKFDPKNRPVTPPRRYTKK